MAVKMLTFLGIGNYSECTYKFEQKSSTSPFVQIALAQIFKPEEVYVFLTGENGGSRTRNWEGHQRQFKDGQALEVKITGLKALAADLPEIRFHAVDIPDGRNMDELWEIFNELLACVQDGDEIIFDVTHSFRSIPIIALAGMQYLRVVKKDITLRGIYYGAYDARDKQTNTAPIFDLTAFVSLMDWSQAVHAFTSSGQIAGLKKLLKDEATPLLKSSKGQNIEGQGLKGLTIHLDALAQDLATCRGQNIYTYEHRKKLISSIETLKQESSLVALTPVLDLLEKNIQDRAVPGSEETRIVRRGFEAVRWCLAHGQTQQAYTFLQENIITHVCLMRGQDYQDRKTREACATALIKASQKKSACSLEEQEWVQGLSEEIFKAYDALSKKRNNINHCGIVEPIKATSLQQDIESFCKTFLKYLPLN